MFCYCLPETFAVKNHSLFDLYFLSVHSEIQSANGSSKHKMWRMRSWLTAIVLHVILALLTWKKHFGVNLFFLDFWCMASVCLRPYCRPVPATSSRILGSHLNGLRISDPYFDMCDMLPPANRGLPSTSPRPLLPLWTDPFSPVSRGWSSVMGVWGGGEAAVLRISCLSSTLWCRKKLNCCSRWKKERERESMCVWCLMRTFPSQSYLKS